MSRPGGAPPADAWDDFGRPPVRTLSPRALQVVAAARHLLETEGPDALTMRRIGDALGIRAPSLYKHFPAKQAVETALIEAALVDNGEASRQALRSATPAKKIAALLAAYRTHALAHPNLYRLATAGRLSRQDLVPGIEDWAGAPFLFATGDPYLGQALWSFAHGTVILELDHRYPEDSDITRTWAAGAKAFTIACRPRPR